MCSVDNRPSRPCAELFLLLLIHKALLGEINNLPNWARYVAMDASGELYAFSHPPKPYLFTASWIARRGYSMLIEEIGYMTAGDRKWLDWEECCVNVDRLIQLVPGQNNGRAVLEASLPLVVELIAGKAKDAWI